MNRTLKLRRETLTELSPDELGSVVAGDAITVPWRQCLVDAATVAMIATALSICVTCLICTGEQDMGDRL